MSTEELQTVEGCVIYKIESPSGKVYIGQSKDIKKRYRYHLSFTNVNTKLGRSYLKYGKERHIFTVVEHCEINNLSDRELYYIDFYDSKRTGLNTLDRNYTYLHTEDVNSKIKEGVTKSWTSERRENQSKVISEKWKNGNYGNRDNSKRRPNPMYPCRRVGTLEKVAVPLSEFLENRHLYVGNSRGLDCSHKKRQVLDVLTDKKYEGVLECINSLKISNTTFYKKIKQGDLKYI